MGERVARSTGRERRARGERSAARTAGGALSGQRFGAHMSVAGGIENAFQAGVKAGCDCLQIFVKNQRRWSAPPLSSETIAACRQAADETGLHPVVSHASYLLNLASPDAATRKRSIAALVDEIERCSRLGVPFLVLHPGAHMGEGVDAGIRRIVNGLDKAHARSSSGDVQVLLETAAGQGTSIGFEVTQLGRILARVKTPQRFGVCVDTCHVFAAGYDIRRPEGHGRLLDELVEHVGLARVKCIHVNDSMRGCGSRVDRHEHIGKGKIGRAGFRFLVNDSRLARVPKILETPKGCDGRGTDLDRVNLKRLRGLIASVG